MKRDFALIHNNKVVNICPVDKETVEESLNFLNTHFSDTNGTWIFFDNTQKKHRLCGVGAEYNPNGDYFFIEKPFNSWVYNDVLYRWEPPIPYPDGQWNESYLENNSYIWNEASLSWILKT